MNHPLQKIVLRRQMVVVLVIGITLVFLVLLNVGAGLLVRTFGTLLEQSLDRRLKGTASFTVELLERDLTGLDSELERSLARLTLSRIRSEYQLESAYIISADASVLLDSRADLEAPISRQYVRRDSSAIEQALSTGIAVSPLYTLSGSHFKNVYASLGSLWGEETILVLEADADFFETIRTYKHIAWLAALFSAILLIILAVSLSWSTRRLFHTEKKLQESRRLAAMGQMAATVAHEIRNPLGIIKSTTDVLQERYTHPDNPDELFGFINDEIRRINHLVTDFLDLSRDLKPNINRQDLATLVQTVIQQVRQDHPSLTFVYQGPETLKADYDRDMIQQVLLNLLINATQAVDSEKGQIHIHLALMSSRTRETVQIRILDNGPGFKDDPEMLFEPFYTTKHRGIGLGLAVSRQIVQRHHGDIGAKRCHPNGSEFVIILPARWKAKVPSTSTDSGSTT
jgi:signal transduction histidine kinase